MFLFLSVVLLFHITVLFLLQKKQGTILLIENLMYSIMGTMGMIVFLSAILRLFHLPLVSLSMSLMMLVSAGVMMFCVKKKGIQKLEFRIWDLLFLVILLGFVALYAKGYFTTGLRAHFISSDAGRHFSFAYEILSTGKTEMNMYYAAMNESVLMMIFKPFVSGTLGYVKVFVLAIIFDFVLSGALMYALIARYIKSWKSYCLAVVLCMLYVLGYPLYAVQFGFIYFEAAILIIQFLLLVMRDYLEESSVLLLVLLNVELFALMVCYTYFVPVVFLSLFFAIVGKRLGDREKLLKIAIEEFRVFLVPSVLGLYFSIGNLSAISTNSEGGIATDGGCYTDLFSNFIWLIPVAFLGLLVCIKKKKPLLVSLTVFNVLFTAILFYFAMYKKVSPYYYFKEYSLLWLLAFVLFFVGISSLQKENIAVAVLLMAIPIGSFGLSRMEGRIAEANKRFINVSAGSLCNLYIFNYDFYKQTIPMNDLIMECIDVIDKNYSDETCFAIGDESSVAWFEAFTGKGNNIIYGDVEDVKKKVESSKYDYVCVFSSDLALASDEYLWSIGTVVYSNDMSYVVKITK